MGTFPLILGRLRSDYLYPFRKDRLFIFSIFRVQGQNIYFQKVPAPPPYHPTIYASHVSNADLDFC